MREIGSKSGSLPPKAGDLTCMAMSCNTLVVLSVDVNESCQKMLAGRQQSLHTCNSHQ